MGYCSAGLAKKRNESIFSELLKDYENQMNEKNTKQLSSLIVMTGILRGRGGKILLENIIKDRGPVLFASTR